MPVTVISRLALGRLIFGAVVIALAAWVFFWGALHPRSVPKYDPNGPVAQIGATRVGGFLGGIVCLLGLAFSLNMMISSRGRAIWVESGQLVFAGGMGRRRIPLADIQHVSLGTDTGYARGIPLVFGVIELHRRGGNTDRIGTSIMAEEEENVLARLQEVLENRQGGFQESRAS